MRYFMGPRVWDETVADLTVLGHEQVGALNQAQAYINTTPNPAKIPDFPHNIGFVQHCFAGVNQLIDAGVITAAPPTGADRARPRWTNAAGAFAQPVAESALGLLLSQAHHHKAFALAGTWDVARTLDKSQAWLYSPREQKTVAIIGAGGIGAEFIRLLKPFAPRIIAVNRTGRPVAGADKTYPIEDVARVWPQADFVVAILPLTKQTVGLFDAAVFAQMKDTAIFINVGRGATVNTDDLVAALREGHIAGAGLEVVDPEPLPDGHPLFGLANCTMTPHMAASAHVARDHIAAVFDANARAYLAGEKMPTEVDAGEGY